MTNDPYLYILMRNDIESLNAGKAIAQGAHAANQFVHELIRDIERDDHIELEILYSQWKNSTKQGFGVTVTLGANINEIHQIVTLAQGIEDVKANITHDPSYPLKDGNVTHLLPLDTCAYVFGDKNNNELRSLLDKFQLYP